MRKRKTVFLLLACLLLTLAAGCGKETQQPQERSKWDILSAKCGEADCTVAVTKNWGGQETGLSCVVTIPRSEGMDVTAVPLTLRLSEGATLDETRTDKAEVIAYALETAGITDKIGLVMVGDREHDVLGAKKNGLPCIGAVYGYGTAGELTAAGAAALAETVDELHKLLLG